MENIEMHPELKKRDILIPIFNMEWLTVESLQRSSFYYYALSQEEETILLAISNN